MSIFTKRNAAIGYLTLKALDRRRRRRSGLRLSLYIALGLISFGILAGVAAVALRRRGAATVEGPEEDSVTTDDAESEIVGEYVTGTPEPIPAT
ncbi:MAG: hypothetical protein HW413_420 [Thermoleophilia bacterium]|nr:hypothetical protein [Thermoleophilia bacterium]